MKPLRVAIIGQGRSGRDIHAAQLLRLPRQYKIVAAVDPIKDRRDRAAAEYGCDVYRDHKSLLKRQDLDLVVNATPGHLHKPVSMDLWQAGHNVLVEKPLARTVKDVDEMLEAATKAGKLFAIFQQSRYSPYFKKVQQVVDSGVLGRVTQINISFSGFARRWDHQSLTKWNGGNLMNTGPHPLDQALRFMDLPLNEVPEVFCHMDNTHFFGDAEGHVTLVMRAPGRPLLNVEIWSDDAYPSGTYKVMGTQGGLHATMSDAKWRYYDPRKAPKHRATTRALANPDGTPAYCVETLKMIEKTWTVPPSKCDLFFTISEAFYKMLHKHMTTGAPLEITPAQVRQQVAVIEECHRQNPGIWVQ